MGKSIFKLLFFIILSTCCTSCATFMHWCDSDTKQHEMYTVYIDSKTKGLPVYVTYDDSEILYGKTPCRIYSEKAKIKYVTVKNGDIYQTITLKRKDRLSTYWNFIPMHTFVWGYFVDKGSSNSRMYSQTSYYVDL